MQIERVDSLVVFAAEKYPLDPVGHVSPRVQQLGPHLRRCFRGRFDRELTNDVPSPEV